MSGVYVEWPCENCGGDGASDRFMDSFGIPAICMDCDGAGTAYFRVEPIEVVGGGRGPAWFNYIEDEIPAPVDFAAALAYEEDEE